MPLIEETEIDFDEMDDEQLKLFLDQLREQNKVRRPVARVAKEKVAKAPKAKAEYIKVEL